MIVGEDTPLAAEWRIALAYTPITLRPALAVVGALDQRIARILAQATEPMLAQMRLAWWRDELRRPASERPQGDAVLDAIGVYWPGQETFLSALVDGWEQVLVEPPMPQQSALAFAAGRAAPFIGLAQMSRIAVDQDRIMLATRRWALADLAAHVSSDEERASLIRLACAADANRAALPKTLRGLAIFEALAIRSLKRGGRPLMEGRGAALTAFKAGMLGR